MPWEEIKPEEVGEKLPSVMGVGRDRSGWEEVSEDEVKSHIYEAYAGPETGGFGITPAPAGVAAMPLDVPPSPFAGVLPGSAAPPPTAVPQVPRVPLGGGPAVTIPIAQPAQVQAQQELEPQLPAQPQPSSILGMIPDLGTPYRAGQALGRMWSKTERGGKYDAIGHAFVNHGMNALLQIPSFAENLEDTGKGAAAWLAETMGIATPESLKALEGAPSLARAGASVSPISGLRAEDVRAAPELVPGGKSFEDSRREQLARTAGLETTRPYATAIGEIGATGGELLVTKRASGLNKLMKTRELRLVDEYKKAKEAIAARQRPSGMEYFKQKITSPGYYKLARGVGRSGEATMEGAFTAAMNGGDPLEIGMIAGLGQGAGSSVMSLASLKGPLKSRWANAAVKALVAGSALTMFELLPGGQEKNPIQALGTGFDKVKLGAALSIGLGMAGLGRTRTQDWAQVNSFMDDIANVPRAATISVVERAFGADDRARNKIQRVLKTMASRPDSFKPHTLDRLSNGLSRGGDAFFQAIEKLEAEGEL